jgi:hypothetical protein
MYSALCNGGPMAGQMVVGEDPSEGELPPGFLYRTESWQWRYDASEIWVQDEFRGYRFDCTNEKGEEVQDVPGYEVKQQ